MTPPRAKIGVPGHENTGVRPRGITPNGDVPDAAETSGALGASGATPDLPDAARHGLAGQFLADVEETTEADPVGVLVTYVASFGALVGPAPRMMLANVEHTARIWPVLVGETAKSRKGTALAVVERVLAVVEPGFEPKSGYGSGEKLVDAVADLDDTDTTRVLDRRLLWVEPEFTRVLKVCAREGSTLSPVMRDAYDGRRLEVRSRSHESVSTGSHIVVIGHVVEDELLRYLNASEVAGGFANRHLFFRVRRVRRLATGGNLPLEVVQDHADRLRRAVIAAREVTRVVFSDATQSLWADLYDLMADDDPPGVLGAVVARPEANVARLGMAYALLDHSRGIEPEHLQAAWAMWGHARASAEAIFGELSGNPDIDRLLTRLRSAPDGLDLTAIKNLFSGHGKGAKVVGEAVRRGLVETDQESTGGRDRTVVRIAPEAPKSSRRV